MFHLHKPYSSEKADVEILKQWTDTLGEERILKMKNPKACIDVILGAIAITAGERTLETYIDDMKQRGQDAERIKEVTNALKLYAKHAKKLAVRFGGAPVHHEEEKKEEEEKAGEAGDHHHPMAAIRAEVNTLLAGSESWKVGYPSNFRKKKKY